MLFAAALVAVPIIGIVAAWFFAVKRPTGEAWRTALFFLGLLLATFAVMAPMFVVLLAAFGIYSDPTLRPNSVAAADRLLLLPVMAAFPLLVLGSGKARWLGIGSSLIAAAVAGLFILGARY